MCPNKLISQDTQGPGELAAGPDGQVSVPRSIRAIWDWLVPSSVARRACEDLRLGRSVVLENKDLALGTAGHFDRHTGRTEDLFKAPGRRGGCDG